MASTLPEISESERDYLSAFGRFVIEWNLAESNLRGLLMRLASDNQPTFSLQAGILTAEMGSITLERALRTYASTIKLGKATEAIEHAAQFYQLLRGYRNYYAHGIVSVLPHEESASIVGRVHTFEAKGKFVVRLEFIAKPALEEAHAIALREYVRDIHLQLIAQALGPMYADGFELPPKPPLPAQLQKSEQRLGELFPPPPSTPKKS
jgi:hypothetical protein